MPFYEPSNNMYATPRTVIEAEWGKETAINGFVSMTIILEIEGDTLSEEVAEWALAVFFMKAAFTTSLPNPFITKEGKRPRYLDKKTSFNNSRSRFQITYPVETAT